MGSIKILPSLRLYFDKEGISASVEKNDAHATKKLLSYADAINTANTWGFNWWAAVFAGVGLFLLLGDDIELWLRALGGISALVGGSVFVAATLQNPKWLWIFPVFAPVALLRSFDKMTWWELAICGLALLIAGIVLARRFIRKQA